MHTKLHDLLRSSRSKTLALAATLLLMPVAAFAQASHSPDAAEQQKVDALVKQMTLQQKLDYIGGTGFARASVGNR